MDTLSPLGLKGYTMSREVSQTVFTFDELSDEDKQAARDKWREFAMQDEWWTGTYEDAATAGIKITGFDLGRSQVVDGRFTNDACHCADAIIENHGGTCPTYVLAAQFKVDRDKLVEEAPRDENGEFESESDLDGLLDKLESEFLRAVLQEYWNILNKEQEYLMSDEAIDESILCNECEFYATGRQY